MKKVIYIFVTGGLLLSSCSKRTDTPEYYPIDSLLTSQVKSLTSMKAGLRKQAILGTKTDTIVFTPKDSAAWSKELDIFRQLDALNKPVNRSRYLVDDNLYDPSSNLTVKAFTSLEPLPVRSLRVFYNTSVSKPRKIEAVYAEENSLYASSRTLSLEFQQINNKTILTSYSIDGGQKMIMGDTVSFSVRARIYLQ